MQNETQALIAGLRKLIAGSQAICESREQEALSFEDPTERLGAIGMLMVAETIHNGVLGFLDKFEREHQ